MSYGAKVGAAVLAGGGAGLALAKYHVLQRDYASATKAKAPTKPTVIMSPPPAPSPAPATPGPPAAPAPARPWTYLAVYLTPESRQNLQKQLTNLGIGATHEVGSRVVVKSSLSPQDVYMYQPLFGERAAFRIKGIVRTQGSDLVAGLGRVSTVAGELRDDDDDCEASVTLYPKARAAGSSPSTLEERCAMDLPTRLRRTHPAQDAPWHGRLAATTVAGVDYPAEEVAFEAYGWDQQVVVDGRICSSDMADEQGGCSFDRASLSDSDALPGTNTNSNSNSNSDSSPSSPSPPLAAPDGAAAAAVSAVDGAAEGETECPVCRFMKAGPCREAFLVWDACVQGIAADGDVTECFPPTVAMMACMRGHEYYDIMTANSEEKMMQAGVAGKPKEETS